MTEKAQAIFLKALDLADDVRSAHVIEACGGDALLREDVEKMLADALAADSYFSESFGAGDFSRTSSRTHKYGEGDRIGPYVLVRTLGEGGFGVVWEAMQSMPIKRQVALKVIKAGMDTEEVLLRFDAERQALARMDHPHIAKVLDAGATPDGHPYFSMELVSGKPITDFCAEHELDIKTRLALFIQTCSAIQHAHQKGVIHRDIKPSNVLVATDESGLASVKVIDFGVAKAVYGRLTDASLHTRQEQWLGTPAYMSPEQAGLGQADIDTRSDIYSLGVLLYELLAGEAPFVPRELLRRSYEEIRRVIRDEDPPRLSVRLATAMATPHGNSTASHVTWTTKVGRTSINELDWIVTKAMEKDRDLRYETVAAFADDIDCHLNDRPVVARPPGRHYMLMKFAQRHRNGIHVASAFIILLVGAVLLSVLLAVRARDAEKLAQRRLVIAIEDRNEKNRALSDAEEVSRLLCDILERLRPSSDGRSIPIAKAIDEAIADLDSRFSNQPKRAAMLKDVLAGTFENLGSLERSYAIRKRIFDTCREQYGNDHPQTRLSLRKLMDAARMAGKSQALLDHALLQVEILGKTDANALEMESARRAVVSALFGVGERERAIVAQRELVEYCQDRFGDRSKEAFMAAQNLKQITTQESIVIRTDAAATGTSDAAKKRGTEMKQDRLIEAQNQFKELVQSGGSGHPATIMAQNKLANLLISEHRETEAVIHLEQIAARSVDLFGPLDDRTLEAQTKLARHFGMTGQDDKAYPIQKKVVDAIRERDGEMADSTILAEDQLACGLFMPRRREGEHVGYLGKLLDSRRKSFGENHKATARAHEHIAGWAAYVGDHPLAIKHSEAAIHILRDGLGMHKNATTQSALRVADAFARTGKTREAIEIMVDYRPQILGFHDSLRTLASLQLWTGDEQGYRTTRREMIANESKFRGGSGTSSYILEDVIQIGTMAALDDNAQGLGFLATSDRARQSLDSTVKKDSMSEDPEMKHLQNRGIILYRLGRHEEALSELEKAMRRVNLDSNTYASWYYRQSAPCAYAVMAMAQHKLGRSADARVSLKAAETFLMGAAPAADHPLQGIRQNSEWLVQWLLFREAKTMISGQP